MSNSNSGAAVSTAEPSCLFAPESSSSCSALENFSVCAWVSDEVECETKKGFCECEWFASVEPGVGHSFVATETIDNAPFSSARANAWDREVKSGSDRRYLPHRVLDNTSTSLPYVLGLRVHAGAIRYKRSTCTHTHLAPQLWVLRTVQIVSEKVMSACDLGQPRYKYNEQTGVAALYCTSAR